MSPTRTEPDLLTSLKTGWNDAVQQWWDQSQTAMDPWKQAWETMIPGAAGVGMPSRHHRRHGSRSHHEHDSYGCESHGYESHGCESHGCDSHGCDSCGCESHGCDSCGNPCRCCVPDADVLLNARAGEKRVVAFLLRNPWRRERVVSLAVGPWQVCDGRLEVQAAFEDGESLTLQPCEKRVVRLLVLVRGICDDPRDPKDTKDKNAKDANIKDENTKDGGRFGCDVEACSSAYADVRFEGCARPQRLGVVVHPASCDAVELPCGCGCCDDCGCC